MTNDIVRRGGFELGGSKVDYVVYIIADLKFEYVLDCDGETLNTSILFC